MTEIIPSTSAHLIDRSEDVIFELVWVIKRSILSFPVYITKKKVQSVIDSAVLHWTTWLMVFPRNAGFGRCYLVSTRPEILSNIDRNLTESQLRLQKNQNKINPTRVRIPSQFYCYHLGLKQKFSSFSTFTQESLIKKVLLPQSHANFGAKSKIFQIKRYTVVISILSRIQSTFRIFKSRSLPV